MMAWMVLSLTITIVVAIISASESRWLLLVSPDKTHVAMIAAIDIIKAYLLSAILFCNRFLGKTDGLID
jgi:hypothetical protein